ncbi:MAG: ComEC/Rec2 family competence protein [Candidatus Dependentiae bacterium]|nr:ComEC/Rec2 family competence protein [Candidatus Dependentiae bacterium]
MLFHFTTQHLIIIVIALIAGISFTSYNLLGLLIFCISLFMIYHEQHRALLLTLACCLFFFGNSRYYQNQALYFAHENLLETKCNVIGVVQEILPRLEEQEQICILMKLSEIEINGKQHFINKKIYLFLPHYSKIWVVPYQKILVKNIILQHPNSTSYQEYLIRENIWAVAHPKWLFYTTLKKPSLFMQQINEICALPLQTTNHALSQLSQTLYLSIFCGKKIKSETTTKMKELFQYWGISHHLARSGLHLVILISLLLFLLSFVPCSATKKQWFIVALLCFYYLTTYSSVAFMRAFYMYIFYAFCKQLYIPINPVHILLVTTLLILTINPHHLFFLDFQLSFSITLLILWFCQVTQNIKTIAS